MSILRPTSRLPLKRSCMHLVLCSLFASLAACGGGGDENAVAPLDETARASSAVLREYCGVDSSGGATRPNESGLVYSPDNMWNNNGQYEQSGYVYAWGHAEVSFTGALALQTVYRDHADIVGRVPVSAGLADARGMGVVVSGVLPAQAVGCVRSVAHLVLSSKRDAYGFRTVVAVQWSGRETAELPIGDLDGPVRSGFEFAANFGLPADRAFVYFNVPKTDITEPSSARICQLTTGGARWDCQEPQVQDMGALWSLRLNGVKPGVYMLAGA